MIPTTASLGAEAVHTVTRNDVAQLARFHDSQSEAVSFYFSLQSSHDGSHRQELTMIKDLVQDKLKHSAVSAGLFKDLTSLLTRAEGIRLAPMRLRCVFACSEQGYRQEFDLPAYGSVSQLEVGNCFHLAPLLRAADACAPRCVALVEQGKARAFVVRGTVIQEMPERFPVRDIRSHTGDSRGGWSHHIAGNVKEHVKAYFKEFVVELRRFMLEHGSEELVIGCHESLWGELAPYLSAPESSRRIIGRFDPASFELSPSAVLEACRPLIERHLRRRYLDLASEVESASQRAVGWDEVAQVLEQGRVRSLVLGKPLNQNMAECARCRRAQPVAVSCRYCGSPEMVVDSAEEILIRKALLTDAEIALPPTGFADGRDSVAALLRF